MSSYRFCRTDDIPLLVAAHERCCRPQLPGEPPLDVALFKLGMRELGLWCSSCMVALEDREPVAVLLAAKRDQQTLLWRAGVLPSHQRQGHGRHLLVSLAAKLAILGPPRLAAEVPESWAAGRAWLAACGYEEELSFTDWTLPPAPAPERQELVVPVTFEELLGSGALDRSAPRCWQRSTATLAARAERLAGWAVASEQRIEAWVLAEAGEVLAFGAADPAAPWAPLVFRAAAARAAGGVLRIARVHPDEAASVALRGWGFQEGPRTVLYGGRARPA